MKIGILVVAYNVSAHLARTLDRIPLDFRPRISDVLVCDNHSDDPTYLVGLGYQQTVENLPLTVIRHDRNLGYGGNQKAGYRWAIDHGLDIVVLLHGDGQYAPELLPEMVAPLERDECDAVFGSRMMEPGGARKGGMPRYKFLGNKVLTAFENAMVGLELSEWHSGYRAYSVDALRSIPFEANTDEYDFDSQIIMQLHEAGRRIVELPIPTYYGEEISYVNGMKYARDIAADVTRYRLRKAGIEVGGPPVPGMDVDAASGAGSVTAQDRVLAWLAGLAPRRVLCLARHGDGLAARVAELGHDATTATPAGDGTLPAGADDSYDVVVAADVLDEVGDTRRLLVEAAALLAPGGRLVGVVANFGHWYVRGRVALGAFDYDHRGILDRSHVRFFTRASFERVAAAAGLAVTRHEPIAAPLPALAAAGPSEPSEPRRGPLARLDALGVALRPTLFAYQFLYELRPAEA